MDLMEAASTSGNNQRFSRNWKFDYQTLYKDSGKGGRHVDVAGLLYVAYHAHGVLVMQLR